MRKRSRNLAVLTVLIIVLAVPTLSLTIVQAAGQKAGEARNMVVVGKTDLNNRGYNADVWVHNGFAYVGQWGFADWASSEGERFCPSGADAGVAVIDARDLAHP